MDTTDNPGDEELKNKTETQDQQQPEEKPAKESKKVSNKRRGFFEILYSAWNWLSTLPKRAAEERKLYRQECLYTVADNMPEDAKTIFDAKYPVIWILATPGAPITEIIVRLCASYKWYHISLGSLLQRELSIDTGREDLLHRGISLPRAFIFELIRKQMANVIKIKYFRGFIFTDYPSTLTQINELGKFVCKPDFILYLKFSDKLTQENLNLYLKFQVRASNVLRKLQPDVHVVSIEQTKKYKREIERIYTNYSEIFKPIDASMSVEEVCPDIMKWIERASIIHQIIPPLFVEPPLHDYSLEMRREPPRTT